jgi:hypothetical protein
MHTVCKRVLQRAHPCETDQEDEHNPQLCYVGATKSFSGYGPWLCWCVPCVVHRAACCKPVHAPHSPPLGLCARAAIMPRCKGGRHMRTLRACTAGPVWRRLTSTPACRKSSRVVCASPRSHGLNRDAAWAHAQSACSGAAVLYVLPPSTPRLTRGVASQCPSTILGRREAGPTARAKRESVYFCTANVLTSKQRSATSSTVLTLLNAGHLVLWRFELLIRVSLIPCGAFSSPSTIPNVEGCRRILPRA